MFGEIVIIGLTLASGGIAVVDIYGRISGYFKSKNNKDIEIVSEEVPSITSEDTEATKDTAETGATLTEVLSEFFDAQLDSSGEIILDISEEDREKVEQQINIIMSQLQTSEPDYFGNDVLLDTLTDYESLDVLNETLFGQHPGDDTLL